ncbi:ferritin-like domain-containing protein [Dyadobacter tibetensis]|uniref:ferritin-like domain-containing protein n=1 Tax=Dyadobacter tibetensis TaxID=1211851 RepID=UPI0004727C36|nr:PA2169 family four-helix-bundle protein [Dyadobacter tibetensis]
MENTNEDLIELLNDLILINNDRIVGYEKAIDELKDINIDLKAMFKKMAAESREYRTELATEVASLGGEVATGTTNIGKVYRVFMDVKATFSGKDRDAVLSSCLHGEEAAQDAYASALDSNTPLPVELRHKIALQKNALLESRNLIKNYRSLQSDLDL